jgi:hypothetical protein
VGWGGGGVLERCVCVWGGGACCIWVARLQLGCMFFLQGHIFWQQGEAFGATMYFQELECIHVLTRLL